MSQIRSVNDGDWWDRIFGVKPFVLSKESLKKLKRLRKRIKKHMAERDVREGGE